MRKIIFPLLILANLVLGAENIQNDTKTHKVLKSSPSSTATADFDFSDVTVIGLPGGGGGGGTPGGTNRQLQFNNSATFGGVPYILFDGTSVTQQAGARYTLLDPLDITKKATLELSAIPTATIRTVFIAPGANSVTVVPSAAPANNFSTGIGTDGVNTFAQPTFANLSGLLGLSQTSISTNKLVGRGTAGTGAMEEITLGTNLSLVGTTLNATGGGGTPGGSTTQLQFNNAGVFGGVPSWTWNGTVVQANANAFQIADATDPTKKVQFIASFLPTGAARLVRIAPSADSVTVVGTTSTANNFVQYIDAGGVQNKVQPSFSNLSGSIGFSQNTMLIAKEIWVDATNGNDGTGARGNLAKPFLTIGAALAASSAGDVVYIGPGTFPQGTTPLVVPAGVTLVGSGADYTIITTAVLKSSNRAGVEGGTGGAITNLTIQTTAASGMAFGNNSSSSGFTSFYLSNLKLIGVSDGILIGKTGTTGLFAEDLIINSQIEGIFIGTAGAHSFRACNITVDGTATTSAKGIEVTAGTAVYRDGSIAANNATTTNTAALGSGATSVLELHNVALSRNNSGSGGNRDLSQAAGATVKIDNVTRDDGAALTNTGTITRMGLDFVGSGTDHAKGLVPDPGAVAGTTKYLREDATWQVPPGGSAGVTTTGSPVNGNLTKFSGTSTITNGDLSGDVTTGGSLVATIVNSAVTYAKMQDVSGNSKLLGSGASGINAPPTEITLGTNLSMSGTTLNAAGGGAALTIQDVGDADATIAPSTQVVNLTTLLTANRVLTLPAASSYATYPALTIIDPRGATNGGTISIARAGSDTINGLPGNFALLGPNESGGMATLLSDGVSKWTTVARGGAARQTGYIDGTTPTTGTILRGNGTRYGNSIFTLASPGASGNVLTSDGTNWLSSAPSGAVSSVTGTSPVTVSPTTGATVVGLNVGVDHAFTVAQSMSFSDALTNTVVDVLSLSRNSSNAGAAGLGAGLVLKGKTTTTNDQTMGEFAAAWVDPTNASRKSQVTIKPATASGLSTVPLRYYTSGYLTNGANIDSGIPSVNAGSGYTVNDVIPPIGKILRSDGATYKDSAYTMAAPGTSGNVLTSDGTNWNSTAPAVTTSNTATLTNKRINPRVDDQNIPTSPYAINSDNFDEATLRAIGAALTLNAPTGTPVEGQKLLFRLKDDGTARALTFQTGSAGQFRASTDLALPTTTTLSKTLYLLFIYNATDSRWDLLAKLDNF